MSQLKLKRVFTFSLVCGIALCSTAFAQLPQIRLYSLLPSGGQIGQEFEVQVLSGADLEEIKELVFSHPKIEAKQKMTESNGMQIPVANTFIVKIPADVPTGVYEVRCGGLFGFSNPRRFAVDHSPVAADPADNNTPDKAAPFELGQVVNGRLESGNDIDWFRVSAKAGQRIVFDTWSERLDSRMNPVVAIYNGSGRRRLDWSRNSIGYDPVLAFDVPADGDYCIEIRDITYRNGNEYFYRLHARTNPHIEFVWPPSGQAGTKGKFSLYGYNLPGGQKSEQIYNDVALDKIDVEIDIPAQSDLLDVENRVRPVASSMDAFSYRFDSQGVSSNPVRIGISAQPVVAEVEPNSEAATAQLLAVPVEVGGQFGQIADSDRFRFEAKAGEVYFIEAVAERLGSNADPYMIVNQITKPAEGPEQVKRLTAQDDVATNLLANVFETKTDDPAFRLQIPADGLYEVILRDRYWEARGHPMLRYTLSIRIENPDFRIVAVPVAPTVGATWPTGLRQGDQFPISVLAFRQDGFNGPITLSAEQLPAGLSCPEVVIGAGVTSSTLVITSAADAPVGLYGIKLNSTAHVDNPALERALAAASTAVVNDSKPIADLQKKLNDAIEKVKKPQADFETAMKASTEKPDDANLKTQAENLKKALDQIIAQKTAAEAALNAAQVKLNASQAAVTKTQQDLDQSRKQVTHQVRCGTVVWSSAANVPAISRVTDRLTVSVIAEVAPFQVKSDSHRFTVNQGRQLLIPVQLDKRNGFDAKVTLTTQGLPKTSNIDFPNSALEKGEAAKTLRMFIKENSPPGIYTVWMKTSGPVSYSRNPANAERLKKLNDEAKVKADEAKAVEQAATQSKTTTTAAFTEATKKLQESQTQLKTAVAAIVAAKANAEQLKKVFDAATQKVNELNKQSTELATQVNKLMEEDKTHEANLKTTETSLATLQAESEKAAVTISETEKQVAELTKSSSEQPENADLKTQLETVTQTLKDQQTAQAVTLKKIEEMKVLLETHKKASADSKTKLQVENQKLATAQQQLTDAKKVASDADTKVKESAKALLDAETKQKTAQQTVTVMDTALKASEVAKTAAETAEKTAQAASKATEAQRVAAEKLFKAAEAVAKPKNINFTPPTTPIVVEVKPSPVKLAATVPNGGKVKKGETLELTLKVTRQNNFAGPVQLTLASPPGVNGLAADPVEIPADQAEGKIIVKTTGDAPDGKIGNVVVRAVMQFDGNAEVDAPITIELTK
ncbi:hypothetical protein N9153_00055 [Planctomicrobium sp.]|nr:hypothetical protein [Planctomicrobium sp.]